MRSEAATAEWPREAHGALASRTTARPRHRRLVDGTQRRAADNSEPELPRRRAHLHYHGHTPRRCMAPFRCAALAVTRRRCVERATRASSARATVRDAILLSGESSAWCGRPHRRRSGTQGRRRSRRRARRVADAPFARALGGKGAVRSNRRRRASKESAHRAPRPRRRRARRAACECWRPSPREPRTPARERSRGAPSAHRPRAPGWGMCVGERRQPETANAARAFFARCRRTSAVLVDGFERKRHDLQAARRPEWPASRDLVMSLAKASFFGPSCHARDLEGTPLRRDQAPPRPPSPGPRACRDDLDRTCRARPFPCTSTSCVGGHDAVHATSRRIFDVLQVQPRLALDDATETAATSCNSAARGGQQLLTMRPAQPARAT